MFKKFSPVEPVIAQTEIPIETPAPKPTPGTAWIAFKQAAQKVCPMYNYPCSVVLAQGQHESAYGSSHFCVTRNNCLGLGAVDWEPNQAMAFENMEQSIIEYMRTIRKNFPTAWANRDNPDLMIEFIKHDPATNLNYASDSRYVSLVKSMPMWEEK